MRIRQKWRAPAQPASIGELRRAVGAFAADGGVSGPALDDVRLCMSEALTNAVVHAFCDGRALGTITVCAEFALDGLAVTVNDDGMGFHPRSDSPGLGFGLPTIDALTDRMSIGNTGPGGTEIYMAFSRTKPTLDVVDEQIDLRGRAGHVRVGVEVDDALLGEDVLA